MLRIEQVVYTVVGSNRYKYNCRLYVKLHLCHRQSQFGLQLT